MKLGVWNHKKEWGVNGSGVLLDQADILEAHRFIYLFFDSDEIARHKAGIPNIPGHRIYGKAVQINLSVSRGGGNDNIDMPPFMRTSDNSTQMIITMYVYDTIFDTSITNIQSAEFLLLNSMISSTANDYDLKKSMMLGVNLYEKDIRDKPDVKDMINSRITVTSPSIPEPMYYTMKHQEVDECDVYCLTCMSNAVVHRGIDILDEFTKVSVMDTSMMDTMEPRLRAKLYEIKNLVNTPSAAGDKVNMYDQIMLSEWLLYQDFESMQSGYTYIYDTNMGFNIVKNSGGYIPFTKYQFEDKMVGDLERTMRTIKHHASMVEKQFGPVRMTFTPMYYGDKTDVYFKDYNPDNQPTVKENVNIDSGSKIKNEVSGIIKDSQQEYIEYELDGDIGGYNELY